MVEGLVVSGFFNIDVPHVLRELRDHSAEVSRRVVDSFAGRTQLHFLHIGKAGGTAIKHALTRAKPGRYRLNWHGHNFVLPRVTYPDQAFFFLRDPLSRFVSGFYSRQRQGRPRYNAPWTETEELAFSTFRTPNDLGEALSSSLRDQAIQALNGINHIKDPLSYWLGDIAYLRSRTDSLYFVGFSESLPADFGTLCQKLGVEAVLPEGDLESHRNPASVDRFLSPVALRNLKGWYAEDIGLYQFAWEAAPTVNARE